MTDPILQTPPLEPFSRKTPEIVRNTPTYSETLQAQIEEYFAAPVSSTLAEARGLPERDIGFNINQYLLDRGIDPRSPEGRRIAIYGVNESSTERMYQLY